MIRLAGTAAKRMKRLGAVIFKIHPGFFKAIFCFCFGKPIGKHIPTAKLAGVQDPSLNKLARYKSTPTGRKGSNAARDFHRFVHRNGKAFPVKISTTSLRVRKKVRLASGRQRRKECHFSLELDENHFGNTSRVPTWWT